MAKVKITGHASGTGVITVTAPNTSTDRTITLPDATATIATTTDVAARLPSITDNGNATAITIDSSENVGIGVVPKSFHSSRDVLQIGVCGAIQASTSISQFYAGANSYTDTAGVDKYIITDEASRHYQTGGNHNFQVAPSGSADAAITWTNALTITNDGRGLSQFTAKAWVNFHGTGTIAINDSHNVSSLTDIAEGNYRVNFSNAMANANYSYSGAVGDWDVVVTGNTPNTAYAPVNVLNVGSHNQQDKNYVMIQVFGD